MQEQEQRPRALLAEGVDRVAAELGGLAALLPRADALAQGHGRPQAKRLTKARAVSATSRHLSSIVSE